jgi:putative PIN family toxin of toxin-antitoxin system
VGRRPRVVVDTGVVVSAFAFGRVPQRALEAVLRSAEVCVSPELLAEYRAVPQALLAARKITAEQFGGLVAGIAAFVSEARMLVPTQAVRVCRDRKDDMVLECCWLLARTG